MALVRTREKYTEFWWGKPERNRKLGRPRYRQGLNIKTNLKEIV